MSNNRLICMCKFMCAYVAMKNKDPNPLDTFYIISTKLLVGLMVLVP